MKTPIRYRSNGLLGIDVTVVSDNGVTVKYHFGDVEAVYTREADKFHSLYSPR